MTKIKQILSYIFNESMTEGIYPEDLKKARVVQIFKSGNPSSVNMPISTLSIFYKINEISFIEELLTI